MARKEELYYVSIVSGCILNAMLMSRYIQQNTDDGFGVYLACKHGHLEIVSRLLDKCKIDPSTNLQYAFDTACKCGHVRIVQKFISDGNVDAQLNRSSALSLALENKHEDVVSVLLYSADFIRTDAIDIYYKMVDSQLYSVFGRNSKLIRESICKDGSANFDKNHHTDLV